MVETDIPDYPRGVTFEQVWAGLSEYRKRMEERDERFTRQMKELNESVSRQMQETDRRMQETDRLITKTGKQIGELGNRFGEIAEHLVAPGIKERFNELGYHFRSMASGGYRIFNTDGSVKTEIDIILENDESVIAVEVKAKPKVKDVEHHIRRLEILREFRGQKFNDERKIMGAIAGAIFGEDEKTAAIEAGMYVIEQSGDTMKINIPEGFIPKEW